jgi:hypothetical protein
MRGIVVWVRLANVIDAGATVVEKGQIERHLQKRAFGKIVPIASDLRQLVHRFDEIDHMGVGFIFAETTCSLTA